MKILVFGAGAIGSLFGGLLSKNNEVVLIGRKPHVYAINKKGLKIKGKTNLKLKVSAFKSVKEINFFPDLIIISVKSYDTDSAVKQIKHLVGKKTMVMSLQNGLGNIEKICKYVNKKNILACVTTHGAIFSKPGEIFHTGIGKTTIGGLNVDKSKKVQDIVQTFSQSKIKTIISKNIIKEIWIKAIINSSINSLTTFFKCKNGYLFKNPVLKKLVEKTCNESTAIANSQGFSLKQKDMIDKTFEVISDTSENYSSMLQSKNKGQKTEINSINGKLVEIGKKKRIDTFVNDLLLRIIN